MLIIRRIVVHLHDRQKITVFLPFNSPANFGGHVLYLSNHSASWRGAIAVGHPLIQIIGGHRHSHFGCRIERTFKLFLPPTKPLLLLNVTHLSLVALIVQLHERGHTHTPNNNTCQFAITT